MSIIFLEGKKTQVSCSVEVLDTQTGIPKGTKKIGYSEGEERLTILEFGGNGG